MPKDKPALGERIGLEKLCSLSKMSIDYVGAKNLLVVGKESSKGFACLCQSAKGDGRHISKDQELDFSGDAGEIIDQLARICHFVGLGCCLT